jgi:valyl-tRNA synthetase
MDKKYDFQKTEEALQEFWEREGIYQYQNEKERKTFSRKIFSQKTFSVDTPPPTVRNCLQITDASL